MSQQTLRSLPGTSTLFAGDLPVAQPGFRDAQRGDADVKALVQSTLANGAVHVDFNAPTLVDVLQQRLQKAIRYQNPSTIKVYQRQVAGGDILFFANQSAKADKVALQVQLSQPLWWFDAQSGNVWPAQIKSGVVDLELAAFESRFLISGVPQPPGLEHRTAGSVAFAGSTRSWVLDNWTFALDSFVERGPLFDWRDRPALVHARGPGVYRSDFVLDKKKEAARYLLNLGLVQGSALVVINGRPIGRASIPPFIVDISPALQEGKNSIEIQLLAPLRNYFVGRALAGDEKYLQMERYTEQLVAAGVIGPVAIAESVIPE
jgi:hypothetical protein